MSNVKMIIIWITGFGVGVGVGMYNHEQKKYSMNLKCVQGELYEEIKPNFFVKSHLECFEQRQF